MHGSRVNILIHLLFIVVLKDFNDLRDFKNTKFNKNNTKSYIQ